MPLLGAGFLGLGIGAGPLPIIGNLVLHLIYGATLGQLYALDLDERRSLAGTDTGPSGQVNLAAERGLALGLVAMGVIGAFVGVLIATLVMGTMLSVSVGALAGAAFGAAAGALVGSFAGLSHGVS